MANWTEIGNRRVVANVTTGAVEHYMKITTPTGAEFVAGVPTRDGVPVDAVVREFLNNVPGIEYITTEQCETAMEIVIDT